MKSRGHPPNHWLVVFVVAAVSYRRGAEARSLRASEASDAADAAALSADSDDDLAVDDTQAQDEQTVEASVKETESQREVRIARMEQLGKAEMMTLLRQETAVESLAKEQATVEAEEHALEQTQQRLRKKLELLDRGGHLNASDVKELTAAKDGDPKTSAEGTKDGAKEGTDESSKESPTDGAKGSTDDTSEEGGKDGTTEATDESSKESSKDGAKESTEKSSKEVSEEGKKESADNTTQKSSLESGEEEIPSAGTPERDPTEKFLIQVVYGRDSFISMFSYLVLTTIMAVVYQAVKSPSEKLHPDLVHDDRWQYNLMECHDCGRDLPICCWAMWCGAVRWADTMSQPHIAFMSFWPALIFFEIMSGLTSLTIGLTGLILVCVGVHNRQKIRERYKIPHGTPVTFFWDIIAWFCCACCAIAQEARQVELVDPPHSESYPFGKSPLEMKPTQSEMRPDGPLYTPNRSTPPASASLSPRASPPPGDTIPLQERGASSSSRTQMRM